MTEANSTSLNASLPLRPRARLLRILGEDLISSESVALIELVKNAYDADATFVFVRFSGELEPGSGCIEVIDDGHGMALETVRTAWMEPGTPSKMAHPRSESLKRRLLGEKGIGRFAASRLARELELITKRRGSKTEVYAIFDWGQLESPDLFLDEVLFLAEERAPREILLGGTFDALVAHDLLSHSGSDRQGTILRMSGLKRSWLKADFQEIERSLSRMLPPFKTISRFRVILELPKRFAEAPKEIDPPTILASPHYRVTASVRRDGTYTIALEAPAKAKALAWRGRTMRIGDEPPIVFHDSKTPADPHVLDEDAGDLVPVSPACGPLKVELLIWDRDDLGNIVESLGSSLADARNYLDSIAGINIHRDGFRVLPYGEPRNDWLRLDLRRVQKPTVRLSNNQIVGYINISADENPDLKDQSNRQGLQENQALLDLEAIMLRILERIEVVRHGLRPRKAPHETKIGGSLFAPVDLEPVRNELVAKHAKGAKVFRLLDQTEKAIRQQLEDIQIEVARYLRLYTLGRLVDIILHEGRQPITKILNEALHGKEDVEGFPDSTKGVLPDLRRRFVMIEKQGHVLGTVFRKIEPFGGRKRGRPASTCLEELIAETFQLHDSEIKRLGVKTTLPLTKTFVKADESEIKMVIFNLLDNSLYWLQETRKDRREIVVDIGHEKDEEVIILFSDSGPGVPEEIRERIFEPYVSLKPGGHGLGLSIAGEIVNDFYNGDLALLERGPLKGATFRITLRKRV